MTKLMTWVNVRNGAPEIPISASVGGKRYRAGLALPREAFTEGLPALDGASRVVIDSKHLEGLCLHHTDADGQVLLIDWPDGLSRSQRIRIFEKGFCPTGPGGGVDNSCGRDGSGGGGEASGESGSASASAPIKTSDIKPAMAAVPENHEQAMGLASKVADAVTSIPLVTEVSDVVKNFPFNGSFDKIRDKYGDVMGTAVIGAGLIGGAAGLVAGLGAVAAVGTAIGNGAFREAFGPVGSIAAILSAGAAGTGLGHNVSKMSDLTAGLAMAPVIAAGKWFGLAKPKKWFEAWGKFSSGIETLIEVHDYAPAPTWITSYKKDHPEFTEVWVKEVEEKVDMAAVKQIAEKEWARICAAWDDHVASADLGSKAFCPTGAGGGQDNSCSPRGGEGGGERTGGGRAGKYDAARDAVKETIKKLGDGKQLSANEKQDLANNLANMRVADLTKLGVEHGAIRLRDEVKKDLVARVADRLQLRSELNAKVAERELRAAVEKHKAEQPARVADIKKEAPNAAALAKVADPILEKAKGAQAELEKAAGEKATRIAKLIADEKRATLAGEGVTVALKVAARGLKVGDEVGGLLGTVGGMVGNWSGGVGGIVAGNIIGGLVGHAVGAGVGGLVGTAAGIAAGLIHFASGGKSAGTITPSPKSVKADEDYNAQLLEAVKVLDDLQAAILEAYAKEGLIKDSDAVTDAKADAISGVLVGLFGDQAADVAEQISTDEPSSDKAFCPTGPGGGQDNSCSPGGGGAGEATLPPQTAEAVKKLSDSAIGRAAAKAGGAVVQGAAKAVAVAKEKVKDPEARHTAVSAIMDTVRSWADSTILTDVVHGAVNPQTIAGATSHVMAYGVTRIMKWLRSSKGKMVAYLVKTADDLSAEELQAVVLAAKGFMEDLKAELGFAGSIPSDQEIEQLVRASMGKAGAGAAGLRIQELLSQTHSDDHWAEVVGLKGEGTAE